MIDLRTHPFEIDLSSIPHGGYEWLSAYGSDIDWVKCKLRFRTEEDKVKFILRWL